MHKPCLYQDGTWSVGPAFCVPDFERPGFNKVVCGLCVKPPIVDARKVGSGHLCEECGQATTRDEAVKAATQPKDQP